MAVNIPGRLVQKDFEWSVIGNVLNGCWSPGLIIFSQYQQSREQFYSFSLRSARFLPKTQGGFYWPKTFSMRRSGISHSRATNT